MPRLSERASNDRRSRRLIVKRIVLNSAIADGFTAPEVSDRAETFARHSLRAEFATSAAAKMRLGTRSSENCVADPFKLRLAISAMQMLPASALK
jgi:hypothetical protein